MKTMSYDAATSAILSNRRKQTNPKQLHTAKQEMTVVDEADLGSFFNLTSIKPRSTMEIVPPLQSAAPRNTADSSILACKELLLNQKCSVWPFAALFPGSHHAEPELAADLTGGPPPLTKIFSTTVTSTTTTSPPLLTAAPIDQPINLSAVDCRQKRRSGSQLNNSSSTPTNETVDNNGDVLDLSAKPPSLARVSGASPGLVLPPLINEASTAPFVPPKAHSRQKAEPSTKFCRLCSREIELTLLDNNPNGLCLSCQQQPSTTAVQPLPTITTRPVSVSENNDMAATSLPLFPGNINPLAGLPALVPGLVPQLPGIMSFELASALAAHSLLPGVLNAAAQQAQLAQLAQSFQPQPPVEEGNTEIERRKSDSVDNYNNSIVNQSQSPVSSCGTGNVVKAVDSPSSSTFFCAKCNISFRSAKSLEAHQVDYCQQTGHSGGGRKGAKRRSVDAASAGSSQTGQDLVCQLCGYHGHSERGIRVHFNAMHSIGSEIQLEQYLTTMIVRADPSTTVADPLKPENTPPSKRRRSGNNNNNATLKTSTETTSPFAFGLDLAGIKVEPAATNKKKSASTTRTSFSGRGKVGNNSTTFVPSNTTLIGPNTSIGSLRRQPPFECRLCSKTFPDTAKLRLHMRSHEKDESIMYSCKRCNNFTTSVKSDLVRHVKVEHEGVNMRLSTWTIPRQQSHSVGSRDEATADGRAGGGKSSSSCNELASGNSNSSDDGPQFCDICQISFRFKHSYEAHRQYYCMAKWTESTNTGGSSGSAKDGGSDVDETADRSSSLDGDQKVEEEEEPNDDNNNQGEVVEDLSSKRQLAAGSPMSESSPSSQQPNNVTNEFDENSSVDVTS